MAPIPQVTPVKKTPADYNIASDYSIPDYWYEIQYNGRKLKYTLEIIGNQPPRDAGGYPLYIAMHGGGTSSTQQGDDGGRGNDNEWNNMYQTFYKSPLANYHSDPPTGQTWTPNGAAVYVTIRGVSTGINPTKGQQWTDDYDLHSRPEGQVLVERLIVHLLGPYPSEFSDHPRGPQYTQLLYKARVQNFVNSNRVYLLGFSAGGNGAFQLGTRLADRFAAILPAAGHPEGASLNNLANLPAFLQVGEDDAWPYGDASSPPRFHRAQVYLAKVNKVLDDCQNDAKYRNRPMLYPHTCTVVKNSDRAAHTRVNWEVHYYWSQSPLIYGSDQQVLKKEYFLPWLAKWGQQNNPNTIQGMPAEAYAPSRVTPIPKMVGQGRKTTPPVVVWDLRGRTYAPDYNDPNRTWEEQRYSYWFYLRRSITSFDNAYQPEWAWCDYSAGNNALHIETPNDYIAYLLEQGSMLNLYAPITVYIAGSTRQPQVLQVTLSDDIRNTTQAARGDTKWQFSAMIYLAKEGNEWIAKSAKTMAEVGPTSFQYPLPTTARTASKL